MNLKDLTYLIAVAETKHFGHAAERCFVSQPTLSGQIKKLEEELQITLFERTNRSVEITPIGETILSHAHQIIEQSNIIKLLAQEQQDPLSGPLRIGAIPTLSPYLMPLILKPIKQQYPKLQLVLSEEMTHVLLDRLSNFEIDAALIATETKNSEFESIALFDEPFWIAHPRDHQFSTQDSISQFDLEHTQLLLLSEGHCLADQAMEVCHLNERQTEGDMADLRASSLETLLQLVGAGFGSTLVPALAMRGSWTTDSGIMAQKLELDSAHRKIHMVHRKSYPKLQALHLLAQIIKQNLPNTVSVL